MHTAHCQDWHATNIKLLPIAFHCADEEKNKKVNYKQRTVDLRDENGFDVADAISAFKKKLIKFLKSVLFFALFLHIFCTLNLKA